MPVAITRGSAKAAASAARAPGARRASACRKSSSSPRAERAPSASWAPRPRAPRTTRAPRRPASSGVPSVLPPSATIHSWAPPWAESEAASATRFAASFQVGTTTENRGSGVVTWLERASVLTARSVRAPEGRRPRVRGMRLGVVAVLAGRRAHAARETDVAPSGLAAPVHAVVGAVGPLAGLVPVRAEGRGAQHAPTVRQHLAVVALRAALEHDHVLHLAGLAEALDDVTLLVRVRVALGRRHDADAGARVPLGRRLLLQLAARDGQEVGHEVGAHAPHDALRLGIAEAAVELEHARPGVRDHQSGVEHAAVV